jgi:hypothetical protein
MSDADDAYVSSWSVPLEELAAKADVGAYRDSPADADQSLGRCRATSAPQMVARDLLELIEEPVAPTGCATGSPAKGSLRRRPSRRGTLLERPVRLPAQRSTRSTCGGWTS